MQSGLRFVLVGAMQDKRSYDDKNGEKKFGAQVSWMGGSEFFLMTRDFYGQLPESGEPVILEGVMTLSKFGPRFTVDAVKGVKAVAGRTNPASA